MRGDESFKRSGDRNATPPGAGRRRVEIIKFINLNVEIRFFFGQSPMSE